MPTSKDSNFVLTYLFETQLGKTPFITLRKNKLECLPPERIYSLV